MTDTNTLVDLFQSVFSAFPVTGYTMDSKLYELQIGDSALVLRHRSKLLTNNTSLITSHHVSITARKDSYYANFLTYLSKCPKKHRIGRLILVASKEVTNT